MQLDQSLFLPAHTAVKPTVVVQPSRSLLSLGLREVWRYRELLYFLVWRDIKIRYKQTLIGAMWAVFQPLLTILIFTIVFGYFVNVPSDGLPYPIFVFAALLPWTYFSEATSRSSGSLVGDANLLRKVYFPRLIIPLASVATPMVDFGLAFGLFIGMLLWYGMTPTTDAFLVPVFIFLAMMTALSVSLWLAALNVRYRDIRHTVPFLIQFWMYASPIVYPASVVPEKWRVVFALNPMTGVIEGFRWALLGSQSPDFSVMIASATVVLLLLFGGLVFFRRMERTFADVV
jgi:lipopolysaccharide transport system permease protein